MASKSYQLLIEKSSNEMDFPEVEMVGPFGMWGEVLLRANEIIDRGQAKYVEVVSWSSGKVLAKIGTPWNEQTNKPGP